MSTIQPVVVVNIVGLTPVLAALGPRLREFAQAGALRPLAGVVPAVTLSAQASMLTGVAPNVHGVVGNGWYRKETGEVRFWVQARTQLRVPTFYEIARERAASRDVAFSCAKLFWWFNQGAAVDVSVTPKPHYGADGSKEFDIQSIPAELGKSIEDRIGKFPFSAFWGPRAGIASSRWIAQASAIVIDEKRPPLAMIYLPHLDYELQRKGPGGCDLTKVVGEVDECFGLVLDAARRQGGKVMVVSEYGIGDVKSAVVPNVAMRRAGLLAVRDGPFGETIDMHASRAFAVCDHQLAHVYVRDARDIPATRKLLEGLRGVARVLDRGEQRELSLDDGRSGDLVALSTPESWFAYPYWLDAANAPDFARTVAIHAKPGYDPCELFIDPNLKLPLFKVTQIMVKKALGLRYLFDVIPLDPDLVRGSHGLAAIHPEEGPVLICDAGVRMPANPRMLDIKDIVLETMGLGE